jgi:DNA-binding beta-propeller fold protein YncE
MNKKRLYTIVSIAAIAILAVITMFFVAKWDNTILPQSISDIPKPLFTLYGDSKKPLNHPLASAIAADGKIYVSDSGNNQVQVFKANGKYLFAFGQEGKGEGQLNAPYGIATLPDNSVLVSDMQNHRIQQFSAEGKFQKIFLDASKGIKPGILLLDKNELYVSDLANHQVVVMNFKGETLRTYHDGMNFPQGLALLNGKLLVADAGNSVLRFVVPSGEGTMALNGTEDGKKPFNLLRGVAVDNLHRILAVDSLASEIRCISEDGKSLFTIGSQGGGKEQLQYPAGVTIDKRGKIYIADWENNRIQVWGYTKK